MRPVIVCLASCFAAWCRSCGDSDPPATKHATADQARLCHHAGEQGLRRDVRPGVPGAVPAHDLTAQGQLLTQYYGIGHASLDNYIAMVSGQAPNLVTQADCPLYFNVLPGAIARNGQAIGQGCVYPSTVAHGRQPARVSRQDLEGLHGGHGHDLPAPDAEVARRHSAGARRRPVRGTAQPVRLLPLGHRFADLRPERRAARPARRRPAVRGRARRTTPLSPRTSATTATTRRASTASPAASSAPTPSCRPGCRRSWARPRGARARCSSSRSTKPRTATRPPAAARSPATTRRTPAGRRIGPGGGRTGTVLISQYIQPGTTNATPYNHYSLLKSTEDVFGLPYLGFAGQSGLQAFGADVYNAP